MGGRAQHRPGQAVSTQCVAGGGTVALLEAVDESTVQAGLALLQAAVLFEATAPTGHTPGILSIAKATFLEGLEGKTHRLRGGVRAWLEKGAVQRQLPGVWH